MALPEGRKELGIERARASRREVVAMTKKIPANDDCLGPGPVREDGRKIHACPLFQVKKPAEITTSGAVYKHVATTTNRSKPSSH